MHYRKVEFTAAPRMSNGRDKLWCRDLNTKQTLAFPYFFPIQFPLCPRVPQRRVSQRMPSWQTISSCLGFLAGYTTLTRPAIPRPPISISLLSLRSRMASPSPLSLADSAHSFACFPLNHAIQHEGKTPSFNGNNVTKRLPLEKQLNSRF